MKTFSLEATKHPDLFRVVDREGNWTHYFHQPSGRYLRAVNAVLDTGYVMGQGFYEYLLSVSKEEAKKRLEAAGEKGDVVHRAIDILLNGENGKPFTLTRDDGIYNRATKQHEPLSNDAWDALLTFEKFWKDHEPLIVASEMPLWNLSEGYAGTGDALIIPTKACGIGRCRCKEFIGQLGLPDWKTSGKLYPRYESQVSAYFKCDNIGEYAGGRLPTFTMLLRLGTEHTTTGGYQVVFRDAKETNEAYGRYLASKLISDREYKPFDPEADIKNVPDEIVFTPRLAPKKEEKPKAKAKTKKHAAKSSGAKKKKSTDGKSKGSGKGNRRASKVAPVGAGAEPSREGGDRKVPGSQGGMLFGGAEGGDGDGPGREAPEGAQVQS